MKNILNPETLMIREGANNSRALDLEMIFAPFRPKGPFELWMDYEIDFNATRVVLEWPGDGSSLYLIIHALGAELKDARANAAVFNHMFRCIWNESYKVPEREPHLILGED